LPVNSIVPIYAHSTAAALAYAVDTRVNGKTGFIDIGGGTVDVSILDLEDGLYQTLSTTGNADLGGIDMDERVADWLAAEFEGAARVNALQKSESLVVPKGPIEGVGGSDSSPRSAEADQIIRQISLAFLVQLEGPNQATAILEIERLARDESLKGLKDPTPGNFVGVF